MTRRLSPSVWIEPSRNNSQNAEREDEWKNVQNNDERIKETMHMLRPVKSRNTKDGPTTRWLGWLTERVRTVHNKPSGYLDREQQRMKLLRKKKRLALFSKSSSSHTHGSTAALSLLRRIVLACPESASSHRRQSHGNMEKSHERRCKLLTPTKPPKTVKSFELLKRTKSERTQQL